MLLNQHKSTVELSTYVLDQRWRFEVSSVYPVAVKQHLIHYVEKKTVSK